MMIQLRAIVLLSAVLILASCAPRVGSSIHISKIPALELAAQARISAQDASLFVDQFKDARSDKKVAELNGKPVLAAEELSSLVKEALERTFRDKGFTVSDSAAVVVSGEIRDWLATIHGGMPGGVNSTAAIFIEVYDPANRRIYTGTYHGTASVEHTAINDKDVDTALVTAMQQAVRQVVVDQQLMKLLSSF